MAKVTKNPICTLMNLNTRTRSSTLYANARTVLDSILLKFQRQPKKLPPTSSFREERGRRDRFGARRGERLFSRILRLFRGGGSILELFEASGRFGQASESIGV